MLYGFSSQPKKNPVRGRPFPVFVPPDRLTKLCFLFRDKMLYTNDSFAIPDTKSLLSLLGLGLFSQTIGWVLIANAMPKIRASFTGLILLLQPSLAFIWDVILFNRATSTINWIGVLITLTAIYMGLTGKTKQV